MMFECLKVSPRVSSVFKLQSSANSSFRVDEKLVTSLKTRLLVQVQFKNHNWLLEKSSEHREILSEKNPKVETVTPIPKWNSLFSHKTGYNNSVAAHVGNITRLK